MNQDRAGFYTKNKSLCSPNFRNSGREESEEPLMALDFRVNIIVDLRNLIMKVNLYFVRSKL